MIVRIDIRYGTCFVKVKEKRLNQDGTYTYKGVSKLGTHYQFTEKQIVREEEQ